MTRIWRLGLVLLFVAFSLTFSSPVGAQNSIQVTLNEHEYAFREHITFRLEASSETKITEITLFVRIGGESGRQRDLPDFEPAQSVLTEIVWDEMAEDSYRPPGVVIKYWWKIEDAAGNTLKTEPNTFTYLDDKHSWQVLENEDIALYWYRGDDSLGSTLFERAVEAIDQISTELGVEVEDKIKIFVYGTYDDLRASLGEGSHQWVGGTSFTDYAVIAAGVAPSNIAYGLRVIPHELTHAVIAQMMEPPFGQLPHWMDEGLAMHYEGPMTGDETVMLQKAIADDSLLSIRSLSSNFPQDYEQAILSYAESNSVIEYIFEVQGNEAMARLLEVFAVGAHQDDAFIEVLGFDVDGLEDRWREHIGAPPRKGATYATPIPLPTKTFTPAPAGTSESGSPSPQPTLLSVVTPAPTATFLPEPSKKLCCLGLLPGAALFGLFLLFRPRPALS
ncbi:MAG: hypothetical protein B6I34_09135 [Anaerolineaceae bacterium 4572_32.1]|nr:MAG: hypothetical protein B6I34_09135 [Anaerolineaceae bacterium 4572_32.1]